MKKHIVSVLALLASFASFAASPAATEQWVRDYVGSNSTTVASSASGTFANAHAEMVIDGTNVVVDLTLEYSQNLALQVVSSSVAAMPVGMRFALGYDGNYYNVTNAACTNVSYITTTNRIVYVDGITGYNIVTNNGQISCEPVGTTNSTYKSYLEFTLNGVDFRGTRNIYRQTYTCYPKTRANTPIEIREVKIGSVERKALLGESEPTPNVSLLDLFIGSAYAEWKKQDPIKIGDRKETHYIWCGDEGLGFGNLKFTIGTFTFDIPIDYNYCPSFGNGSDACQFDISGMPDEAGVEAAVNAAIASSPILQTNPQLKAIVLNAVKNGYCKNQFDNLYDRVNSYLFSKPSCTFEELGDESSGEQPIVPPPGGGGGLGGKKVVEDPGEPDCDHFNVGDCVKGISCAYCGKILTKGTAASYSVKSGHWAVREPALEKHDDPASKICGFECFYLDAQGNRCAGGRKGVAPHVFTNSLHAIAEGVEGDTIETWHDDISHLDGTVKKGGGCKCLKHSLWPHQAFRAGVVTWDTLCHWKTNRCLMCNKKWQAEGYGEMHDKMEITNTTPYKVSEQYHGWPCKVCGIDPKDSIMLRREHEPTGWEVVSNSGDKVNHMLRRYCTSRPTCDHIFDGEQLQAHAKVWTLHDDTLIDEWKCSLCGKEGFEPHNQTYNDAEHWCTNGVTHMRGAHEKVQADTSESNWYTDPITGERKEEVIARAKEWCTKCPWSKIQGQGERTSVCIPNCFSMITRDGTIGVEPCHCSVCVASGETHSIACICCLANAAYGKKQKYTDSIVSSSQYAADKAGDPTIGSVDMSDPVMRVLYDGFSHAFMSCENLSYVNCNSITCVLDRAFQCAFSNCPSLVAAGYNDLGYAGPEAFERAFYDCLKLDGIVMGKLTTATNRTFASAFVNCKGTPSSGIDGLHHAQFPKLAHAGDCCFSNAFNGCQRLVDVSMPSLKDLRADIFTDAFVGTALTNLDFSGVETVHDGAFKTLTNGSNMAICLRLDNCTDCGEHGSFCFENAGVDIKELHFDYVTNYVAARNFFYSNTQSKTAPEYKVWVNVTNYHAFVADEGWSWMKSCVYIPTNQIGDIANQWYDCTSDEPLPLGSVFCTTNADHTADWYYIEDGEVKRSWSGDGPYDNLLLNRELGINCWRRLYEGQPRPQY